MEEVEPIRVQTGIRTVLRAPKPMGREEAERLAQCWLDATGEVPVVIDCGIDVVQLPDNRRYATRVGRK